MYKYLILLVLSFSVLSCKKTKGCLVPYADNFNPDAKVDDGSCTFTGKRIFWLSKYSSDSLEVLDDSTDIYFYVNDSLIPTNKLKNYQFLKAAPTECGVANALTISIPLGKKEEDLRNIKVLNVDKKVIYETSARFSSAYCHNTEVLPFQ